MSARSALQSIKIKAQLANWHKLMKLKSLELNLAYHLELELAFGQ